MKRYFPILWRIVASGRSPFRDLVPRYRPGQCRGSDVSSKTTGAIPGGIVNQIERTRCGAGMVWSQSLLCIRKELSVKVLSHMPEHTGRRVATNRHLDRPSLWPPLALALLCVLPPALAAQDASNCKGPATLEQTLPSPSSPGALETMGTW